MKLRLQRISRIGVAGVLATGLFLAGLVALWHLTAYRQHAQALIQFDRFALSLQLMAAASTERALANVLLSAAEKTSEETAKLSEARARVDALYGALVRQFAQEFGQRDVLRSDAQSFERVLKGGREAVDAQIAIPTRDRSAPDISAAILTMFRVADGAQVLRDDLGQVLVGLSPELVPLLMAAVSVSDLRDYAGRLGSLVVMQINADGWSSRATIGEFAAMLSLTDTLQRQIENYVAPFIRDQGVERAITAVNFGYFAGSRAYAQTLFASRLESSEANVDTFNDRYDPGLRATEALREALLDVARAGLIAARDRSLQLAVGSAAGAAVFGLLALLALSVLERGIVRPLVVARERMARILSGDLAEETREETTVFLEIDALERDIETLRRHQIDLRRLEGERETLSRELRRLASTDALTGLLNRRAFENGVADLFEGAGGIGVGFGIVMIDIDHFKSINDRFGHGTGDEVLREVGRFLTRKLPPGALVARFGGEEFVMALPDIGRGELDPFVEALRARLEAARILATPRLRVTASFGVHWVAPGQPLDWQAFHRIADDHLYRAKRSGRNRVASSAA
ncbi:GGDEF domain-containing protein [Aureimonas sp. SK2]|uniref:GGDEF domain-containing protein n=1 Tax=Aureimonas sp. SK2 TaxID=3015992 RepID=UPI002444C6EF|nr:GGDEF domain-containing protein [Aureimonas sp. SK2]